MGYPTKGLDTHNRYHFHHSFTPLQAIRIPALGFLGAFCFLVSALFATPLAPAQAVPASALLAGRTPPQVIDGSAIRIGHYDTARMLRVAVAITPPHMAEEEQFIEQLRDPKSPNFRKFLTAAEWTARFDPSAEDEQLVVDWAQAQGLTVVKRYPNRLLVDLEGPAGLMETAFGVTINTYQLGEDVRFSNDRDPLLPPHVAAVVTAVLGLNNIQRMQSSLAHANSMSLPDYAPGPIAVEGGSSHGAETSQPPAPEADDPTANITNNYIDPSDVWSSQMYDYAALQGLGHCCNPNGVSTGTPPETSIALATWGPFDVNDAKGFFDRFGLNWNLTWYVIDGPYSSGTANNDETTLDTEWSTASANYPPSWVNTAHVYIYEDAVWSQNGNADMYNQMLNDAHARVMSTSWSCTEGSGCSSSTINAWHAIFNSMVGQGWTLMAASGDRGASDNCSWDKNNNRYYSQTGSYPTTSVAYPASDPDFLGIGGTSINGSIGAGNHFVWSAEPAWQGGTGWGSCGGNNGGSGGGVSAVFTTVPSYQTGMGGTKRMVPDISLNSGGIGQEYYFKGALHAVGGTSIASPEFAGFFAQENAYLLAIGNICGTGHNKACAPIGDPHGALYYEGQHKYAYHSPYYDTTSGCNSNDVTSYYSLTSYCASAGYDKVTGWGAANMMQLAWALNWGILNNMSNGIPNVTFTGPAVNKWYSTNQTVSWTINDYAGSVSNAKKTGIAGFTQGWDSIPTDSKIEAHPGSGDLFYDGPQYPNATTGCLAFQPNGCSGGVSQGCHKVYVHGWNNLGWTTAGQSGFPETYGPICYDTVAPATTFKVAGTLQKSGWYTTSATVTLTAADPLYNGTANTASGLSNTYYAIDAPACAPSNVSACKIYSAAFPVATSGAHTISYFSVDKAGNGETVHNLAVNVDVTAPTTATVLNPAANANGWNNSAVQVTLNGDDGAGSGTAKSYYSLDSASCTVAAPSGCTAYTGAFTVSTAGSHTIRAFSIDNVGNTEALKTTTVKIDTTSPVTALAVSPAPKNGWGAAAETLTLTATDAGGSGVDKIYYQLDNASCTHQALANCQVYSAPVSVKTTGQHKFVSFSADKAGNFDKEVTTDVNVDVTPPVTLSTASPVANAAGWNTSAVTVSLSATDAGIGTVSKTYYSIDGASCSGSSTASCTVYSAPFAVSLAAKHVVRYFSVDLEGNIEPVNTLNVNIDVTPPTTTSTLAGTKSGTGYTGVVTVTLTAADSGSGVASTVYRLNGGAATTYTGPFRVPHTGSVTLNFQSTDKAGNVEAQKTTTFTN